MDLMHEYLEVFPIEAGAATGEIRRQAIRLAQAIGFDAVKSEEIAIIVNELLSNVAQHGGGAGVFFISKIIGENSVGIEFYCCDFGSGISDNFQALKDGYSNKQSLGIGLGAIERLSDEFALNPPILPEYVRHTLPENPTGVSVFARKWLPANDWNTFNPHLLFGVASRALPGEMFNGDGYLITYPNPHVTLVALIDGLGHGKEAHLATEKAKERIYSHAGLPLEALMNQVHQALKATRGATVAIAQLDTDAHKLSFVGVGNIEARLISAEKKRSLLSTNGIVGHNLRKVLLVNAPCLPGDMFLLFSDGISAHSLPGNINWQLEPQRIADGIIHEFSKVNDDATILIARYLA
jgi:anti-sigma regulatory factor (Ser/Thr protein kinase)